MPSEENLQVVALLQDAGVLTPDQAGQVLADCQDSHGNALQTLLDKELLPLTTLQDLLLRYSQAVGAPSPVTASPAAAAAAEETEDLLDGQRTF